MPYELGDDEVALIIRPTDYKLTESEWLGKIQTGIAVGDNFDLPDDVLSDLVHVATLCTSLLDIMNEDDDLYERVMEHRHNILIEEINKRQEPLQNKSGEVINFNAFTKTRGNA
jgi:hypothetical protein|tara:strand:- start:1007 stop:1348 length:342 start_codon:yes stop_codon:yes gene_type:complete